MNKKNTGFTLIEIVIVIGIMAVFSAVIYSSFDKSRAKSRDQKRVSDVSTIQIALEQYFQKKGVYPVTLNDANFVPTYISSEAVIEYVNNYFPMTKSPGTTNCISYQLWTKFELSNQYLDSKKSYNSTATQPLKYGFYECGSGHQKINATSDLLVYDVMP